MKKNAPKPVDDNLLSTSISQKDTVAKQMNKILFEDTHHHCIERVNFIFSYVHCQVKLPYSFNPTKTQIAGAFSNLLSVFSCPSRLSFYSLFISTHIFSHNDFIIGYGHKAILLQSSSPKEC